MAQNFIESRREQGVLLPPDLREWLPADHLASFVIDAVAGMELSAFYAAYWPMKPGSRWVYRETDSEGTRQNVLVTVTNETKPIANGITARVVRDVVTDKGELVEVTDDWYAQDKVGNVWYLGEATTEYKNGKPVSTGGSFEAGVDCAQAGGHHARPSASRPPLPPGVLQGPSRGQGEHRQPPRAGRSSGPPLPAC